MYKNLNVTDQLNLPTIKKKKAMILRRNQHDLWSQGHILFLCFTVKSTADEKSNGQTSEGDSVQHSPVNQRVPGSVVSLDNALWL